MRGNEANSCTRNKNIKDSPKYKQMTWPVTRLPVGQAVPTDGRSVDVSKPLCIRCLPQSKPFLGRHLFSRNRLETKGESQFCLNVNNTCPCNFRRSFDQQRVSAQFS